MPPLAELAVSGQLSARGRLLVWAAEMSHAPPPLEDAVNLAVRHLPKLRPFLRAAAPSAKHFGSD